MPTADLVVTNFHHRDKRMVDDFTCVEHPAFHVFPDHHVALGNDVLGEVVVTRQRFDADLEAANNVSAADRPYWVHTDIGVVAVVGEEGGHCVPVPLEMGVPVVLDDLFVAGFGAVHGFPLNCDLRSAA